MSTNNDGGWISVKEQPPTKQDANAWNCALFWHELQGPVVTGWHQWERNRFFSHWMPCPKGPIQQEREEATP